MLETNTGKKVKTINEVPVKGRIVLVRTNYDVPLDDSGIITDDLRIQSSLPAINYLREKGASKIILISHLGRPGGKFDPKLSLKPVAARLAELLPNDTVRFVDDNCGPDVEAAVSGLPKGGILLLENLRFAKGEEENSQDFADEIVSSTHADLFVQDGPSVCHRAHASTEAITHILPSVAGLLLEKEINSLNTVVRHPEHPLLVIVGGAKVEDKQPLIDAFLKTADQIAVGGKIAADGYTSTNTKVYVAEDFITNQADEKFDIGPASIQIMTDMISQAKSIIWSGLLGKAEDPQFAIGSTAIAEAMGQSNATTIIGGGDTSGFVENLIAEKPHLHYTLISTGGTATLEYLSGKPLPGLEALEEE